MTEQGAEDHLTCDYCGAPAGPDWLGIETWREDGGSSKDLRVDIQNLGFCSEEHAGRYFTDGQLPPPDFGRSEALPRTWRDRLFDAGVLAFFVTAAAFAVLGAWSLVQWIWR